MLVNSLFWSLRDLPSLDIVLYSKAVVLTLKDILEAAGVGANSAIPGDLDNTNADYNTVLTRAMFGHSPGFQPFAPSETHNVLFLAKGNRIVGSNLHRVISRQL